MDANYYKASGYLHIIISYKARQEDKGLGCQIVNKPNVEKLTANTLLATIGSGRERNRIFDLQEGIVA